MSLKDFKKIGSNEKFTTFKHPNGSFLKVAHKGITKDYRKKLDSLPAHPPEMGMSGNPKALNGMPSRYVEKGPETDFSNVNNMPKMAEGGGVGDVNYPMFHGVKSQIYKWSGYKGPEPLPQEMKGSPTETDMTGRTPEPTNSEYIDTTGPVKSEDIEMARGGMVRHLASGTPDAPLSAQDASLQKLGLSKYKGAINSAPVPAEQADSSTQGVIGPASPLATPVDNEQAVSIAKSAPYQMPQGMSDLSAGYQTQLGGIEKQQEAARLGAQANIGLANQEAETLGTGINQLNTLNNTYSKHYADIQNERQSLMQEMESGAQHLDPYRYVRNMSTGDHILSGISLVLGGIGSGMTHGPNLAAEFLQRNIDRDIENQRLQLGVKQNLLGFNFQNSKDLQDATNFTKLNSMDMLSMFLKRQAAQAQNPLQQSALLNQSGILDQKAGDLQNQIAMRRAFMQIGTGGGQGGEQAFQQQNSMLRMMGDQGAALAKDREGKHVAGVGQGSREVPGDVLKEVTARNSLDSAIRDLQTFAAQHSGSIIPAAITEGHAKAALVQDMVRQASNAGVFKESEKDFMNKYVGEDPTQLFEKYRSGKGYEEVRKNNLLNLNQLKKTYGLPVTQEQARAQESPQEVERITKDKRIAVFDGKTKKFLRYK